MNRTNEDPHHRAGAAEHTDRPGLGAGERENGARTRARPRIDFAKVRHTGSRLARQAGEQARKRPYVALGAASALGFVAGSLFGSRVGQAILAAGIGYAVKHFLEGDFVFERVQEALGKLADERAGKGRAGA